MWTTSPFENRFFGDLHVHTTLSFDAVADRTNTLPADAYNYATGKPIPFFRRIKTASQRRQCRSNGHWTL